MATKKRRSRNGDCYKWYCQEPLVGWRHTVRRDGLLQRRLRTKGHRHPLRVPAGAPGGRRADRGGRGRGGRVVHRDLDGGLDRSADGVRELPGQVLPGRAGPRHRSVHRLHRLRPRPVRGRLDRQPDLVDHRQRVRLQGAEVAAPRGYAHPAALHEDVPGAGARHRDGARVPEQVRPPAARRHRQAQAGSLGAQLRPRRLRGAARRAGLHQGRREHQQPAVHALARSLPVLHGRRSTAPWPRPARSRATT